MAIENFIYFNGTCRPAVEFYAEVFGLEKPPFMICGDTPGNPDFVGTAADGARGLIMYAGLRIKDSTVMFADAPNGRQGQMGNSVYLTVNCDTIQETQEIFHKLAEGGQVQLELQPVFFTECLGSLTDKFGLNWFVVYYPQSANS